MYKLCVTEKSARQQREFEAAVLTLMLEMPYDSITISEICRRAGLSRKIFYRLFEQKGDVLYALIDHTFLDYQNYQPDETTVGRGGMHRFFGFWKEKKVLLDALLISQTSSLLSERAIRHIMQESPDVRHSFNVDTSETGRETLVFYITGLFSLVLDWHQHGYAKTIDEMANLLMSLLMTPPIKAPLRYDPYK